MTKTIQSNAVAQDFFLFENADLPAQSELAPVELEMVAGGQAVTNSF